MQHPRIAAVGTVLAAALVPAAPGAAEDTPPLPGRAALAEDRAEAPGAGDFELRITPVEQGPAVGDRIEYTVRVENTGAHDYPEAAIVQLLPPDLEDPEASSEGEAGPMEASWRRPLPAEEETFVGVTGRVGEPAEGFERLTTIACIRPRPTAGLVDCASHTMPVERPLPLGWIAGGAAAAAAAAGAWVWWRRRPEPQEQAQDRPMELEIEQIEQFGPVAGGAGTQSAEAPVASEAAEDGEPVGADTAQPDGAEEAGSAERGRPVTADRE
ncbi:hypothetical protein [Nocardiopsis halophila]|uniref:hypothetical protein n=1 Tax=Nocardiopsis halophila TaxID=141692 RepID=UPI0003475D82|nr:hypothetical protein [Nocardiopsis halophila]